jgi:hypothetical protein
MDCAVSDTEAAQRPLREQLIDQLVTLDTKEENLVEDPRMHCKGACDEIPRKFIQAIFKHVFVGDEAVLEIEDLLNDTDGDDNSLMRSLVDLRVSWFMTSFIYVSRHSS